MAILTFRSFSGKRWNTSRWQPEIYLADEHGHAFAIPEVDGSLVVSEIGVRTGAALHVRFPVPSFGEVTLPTGVLPPADHPYVLPVELATERLRRIDRALECWQTATFRASVEVLAQITNARAVLDAVSLEESDERNARWGDLALSLLLPAGEALALERANHQIGARRAAGGFDRFLLGCNGFPYPDAGEPGMSLFTRLFNSATLAFYWGRTEPAPGQYNLEGLDRQVEWLTSRGLAKKGHPLFWLLAMPDWVDRFGDPASLDDLVRRRVRHLCEHFRGRVEYYDVVNEMHNWNIYGEERMYEQTRLVSDLVKECDPDALRVVNINEPFGEYMARDVLHLDRTMVPIDVKKSLVHPDVYIERLLERGVDFDVLGVQMYFGAGAVFTRDLFEIALFFDGLGRFGKPIHLTEAGVPSREGEDLKDSSHSHNYCSLRPWRASDAGFWHGPWTPVRQAEFLDGFYRVLMGNPAVTGITYWDFSDANGHFFTHAGLLDARNQPKPAYEALLRLKLEAGIPDSILSGK